MMMTDDDSEELQFGWRSTQRRTVYEHRGSSSLTPSQVMDQQTHYGYAWMSLMQGIYVLQLIHHHLAICLLVGREVFLRGIVVD